MDLAASPGTSAAAVAAGGSSGGSVTPAGVRAVAALCHKASLLLADAGALLSGPGSGSGSRPGSGSGPGPGRHPVAVQCAAAVCVARCSLSLGALPADLLRPLHDAAPTAPPRPPDAPGPRGSVDPDRPGPGSGTAAQLVSEALRRLHEWGAREEIREVRGGGGRAQGGPQAAMQEGDRRLLQLLSVA